MRRDHGVPILLLVIVLVLGLAPGMIQADGVDGESKDADHKEWIDVRPNPMEDKPNPMERPADLSAPAMKPGSVLLPAVQQGSSVAFTDAGTQGATMPAAGSGASVGFTDAGTQGTSMPAMRSGSSVGFTDAGTQGGSTGAMQPGSILLPAVQSGSRTPGPRSLRGRYRCRGR